MTGRRFPQWVYGQGDEPDPRFTLANERTFLAWIRTALALTAAGIALEAVTVPLASVYRLTASLTLIALGLALPALAWCDWAVTERALRRGDPLPAARVALPLTAGVVLVAAAILLGLATR